jgi:hypothetical protein
MVTLKTDGMTRSLFVLSGHDKRAVIQRAKDLEAYLVRNPPVFDCNLLENLAYNWTKAGLFTLEAGYLCFRSQGTGAILFQPTGTVPGIARPNSCIRVHWTGRTMAWDGTSAIEIISSIPTGIRGRGQISR